ncbi:hypothetical protein ACWKT5_37080 [Streptomyces avermitilis]
MDKFEEFLNKRKDKDKEEPVLDKALIIERYQNSVERFYREVAGWLKPYVTDGRITLNYEKVPITEEELGTYDAPQMTIRLGDAATVLMPIGANIIAAAGRIDMKGPYGKESMILVGPDGPTVTSMISTGYNPTPPPVPKQTPYEHLIWKFMLRSPRLHYVPVNEDSFKDYLMKVFGE